MSGTLSAIRDRVSEHAAAIEAPPKSLPAFGSSEHSGRPHAEVSSLVNDDRVMTRPYAAPAVTATARAMYACERRPATTGDPSPLGRSDVLPCVDGVGGRTR